MDNFISLAKQGYEAYSNSQENVSKTGGKELNRESHPSHSSSHKPDFDDDEVVNHAKTHASDSGDSDLFSQALSFAKTLSKPAEDPLDEEKIVKTHEKVYDKDQGKSVPASDIGSAAAMQVLKQFVGGDSKQKEQSHGGGGFQNKLIAAAMGEAAKRFDSSGGAAQGTKQDAVNSAAATIMKLLIQVSSSWTCVLRSVVIGVPIFKSKFGGGTIGGSNSGGLGPLASLASQFLK
ncbi:hypothetical protein FRC02_008432 [Tulasnella sp. 418]|nr:hypothetical protein FRC02_008432 [Tulasnella sp. 418]